MNKECDVLKMTWEIKQFKPMDMILGWLLTSSSAVWSSIPVGVYFKIWIFLTVCAVISLGPYATQYK